MTDYTPTTGGTSRHEQGESMTNEPNCAGCGTADEIAVVAGDAALCGDCLAEAEPTPGADQ